MPTVDIDFNFVLFQVYKDQTAGVDYTDHYIVILSHCFFYLHLNG